MIMEGLFKDIRYSIRGLRKCLGFTLLVFYRFHYRPNPSGVVGLLSSRLPRNES